MGNENEKAHLLVTSVDDRVFINGNQEGLAQLANALDIAIANAAESSPAKPFTIVIGESTVEVSALDGNAIGALEQDMVTIKQQKGSHLLLGCLLGLFILLILMALSLSGLANIFKGAMGIFL